MNFLGEVRAQACDSGLPTPHLKGRDKKRGGERLTLNKTPSVPTKPAPTPRCQPISSLNKLTFLLYLFISSSRREAPEGKEMNRNQWLTATKNLKLNAFKHLSACKHTGAFL